MNYEKINLNTWSRGKQFQHFMKENRIVMSLTVDIDVAPLLSFVKKNGLKFYPTMMWVVTKVINEHEEFKLDWDGDGDLIKWDCVSPVYADFNPENEKLIRTAVEYSEDLMVFHERFLANREESHIPQQLKNTYGISCLPWVKYNHIDIQSFDKGMNVKPFVMWGKHEPSQEKELMPLTMQVHHAVADGFHLSRFFNEVQAEINAL